MSHANIVAVALLLCLHGTASAQGASKGSNYDGVKNALERFTTYQKAPLSNDRSPSHKSDVKMKSFTTAPRNPHFGQK